MRKSARFVKSSCSAIAAIVVLTVACTKPLEVKQDSPQAAVASMIKLYGSEKENGRVSEMIDPAAVRMHDRLNACVAEQMKSVECDRALLKSISTRSYAAAPEGCPVKLSSCTCGEKGNAAAAKAGAFTSSPPHSALKAMKMTVGTCRIKSAEEVSQERLATLNGRFWDTACTDIPKSDPIAAVEVACGSAEPLTFLLRKKDAKWSVVGFSTETSVALWEKQVVDDAKKREDNLNKDMK